MMNPFLLIVFTLYVRPPSPPEAQTETDRQFEQCGVTIQPRALARFWRSWLYFLNPFKWFVESIMSNEMRGLQIRCLPTELRNLTPPSGQTCFEWAGDYIARVGGYLVDPEATGGCQCESKYRALIAGGLSALTHRSADCEAATGDEYVAQYGWSFDTRARNLGVFLCYVVVSWLDQEPSFVTPRLTCGVSIPSPLAPLE